VKSVHVHQGQQCLQGWVGELFTFQLAERVAGDAGGFGRLRLSEPLVVSALTKSISDVNSQLCITLDTTHGCRATSGGLLVLLVG
jgi:hypothetical protein